MTQQAAEAAGALWSRLQPQFDDSPRTAHIETAAGRANWPGGQFGNDIPDVRSVVVHGTQGWPSHNKWNEFVERYTDPTSASRGIGPHFFIAGDGTVFRLLTETLICYHASHLNSWSIGVETGNLMNVAAPGAGAGAWPNSWTALSTDAQDLPNAKLYARFVNNEILVARWTTAAAGSPVDSTTAGAVMMLITEEQYRAWALLARWLAEVWRIPREFPVRPHLMRGNAWQAARWRSYRQIVNAHPMRDPHIRTQLQPAPYNSTDAVFTSDDPATGLPHVYAQGVQTSNWVSNGVPHSKQVNELWTRLFESYRGFHGHGFSGANRGDDHNCPGAWFDWYRFAREVWDYWWYPFDLAQATPTDPVTSGRPRRLYGQPNGVLTEHYFGDEPSLYSKVSSRGFFPVGDESVAPHPLPGPPAGPVGVLIRMFMQYWGFWHGGMHFEINSGSPVYAAAGGKLVAARLMTTTEDENTFHRNDPASEHPTVMFVLLRHEVFFQRGAGGDRINYDQEPTRVYSLYMHLGSPTGLDFTQVVDANPGWLNRAIAMKKEYDLGLAFHTAHPNPAAHWPPHVTRWTRRQTAIDAALTDLQAGRSARFPEGEDAIHVALGDFLGVAGHLGRDRAGVHLEVFSRDEINDPWFERVDQSGSASRPFHDEANLQDVTDFIRAHVPAPRRIAQSVDIYRALSAEQKAARFRNVALKLKSEWALQSSDFPAGGWPAAQQLMWWSSIVPGMNAALAGEPAAQLPADGVVWHYHPLGFLAWLNALTWRSEWPKYRVVDAAGAAVAAPARPPRRE